MDQIHHPATNDLEKLLTTANHDLTLVMNKLESEFRHTYPDDVNPLKLLSRIKKIQQDLISVKIQCSEILSAKQDLIDKARTTLVGSRSLIQKMQITSGVENDDSDDDPAYTNFNKIIDEWTVQVRSKTGGEKHEVESEDINQLLFS